jgi:putrescine aminotransferase
LHAAPVRGKNVITKSDCIMNDLSTLAALQARDAKHHFHPNTDMVALNAEGTRVIVRGEGVWLHDAAGRRILDGFSGLWNVAVGYGRKEIADAAYKQLLELPFYNTFFRSTTVPAIELAEMLGQLAPGFSKVFFTNSGSEGNDTIIRMVRHYWKLRGKPKKSGFIARHNAYHGSTLGGASLGGMDYMHKQGDLPIPGVVHVQQPWWWGEGGDLSPAEFGLFAAREVGKAIDRIGAENVGAFIGEPIQGAGGVIMPPDTYWPEVERICRERDVLIVSDEVICGFGRTGAWFGCNHYGFTPDLMTFAKNVTSGYLPLGGVMVSDAISDVLAAGGPFWHGFTTSGHPVCCAAGVANLKIIVNENLVDRVRDDIGPYLKPRWQKLADHRLVGEARMVGLLGALELTPDKAARTKFVKFDDVGSLCRDFAYQRGLILRATGSTMLTAPPYILSEAEADILVDTTRDALDDTEAELLRRGWL